MEIIRLYKLSDAEMFSYADKVIANLQIDITLFSAFDSTIDATFIANAQNLLTTAQNIPSDNVVIDQQVASTEQVRALMQDCRDQYDDMKFFIKKAFKNSLGRQNEFGLNDYDKAVLNPSEMVRFLGDMYGVADKYRSDLNLVGCSNTIIDRNSLLEKDLNTLVREQSQIMDSRSTAAENRIIANNALWEIIVLISEAAKRVFRRSPANISRYLRPQPRRTGTGGNTDITVSPDNTQKAIGDTIINDSVIDINNTGTTTLEFYVADNIITPTPTVSILTLLPGTSATLVANDYMPNNTVGSLWVRNTDANTAGKFDAILLMVDN